MSKTCTLILYLVLLRFTSVGQSELRNKGIAIGISSGIAGIVVVMVVLFAFGPVAQTLDKIFKQHKPMNSKLEYTDSIVLGTIEVAGGAFEFVPFDVPTDASTPRVRGSYFVNSVNHNDIHVMILEEVDFVIWKAGKTPNDPHYDSALVVAGDIEAKVPIGNSLYLVFDNTHSRSIETRIEVEIELAYLR
jgi:hypothetical protein